MNNTVTLQPTRKVLEFKPMDLLFVGFIVFLSILVLCFHVNLEAWQTILLGNTAAVTVYLIILCIIPQVQWTKLKAFLRIGLYLVAGAYTFETTGKTVHIFFSGWFDAVIADAEHALFGVHPTVFLQQMISPPLTEWLMFAYVIYGPMIPLIAYPTFRRGGFDALEEHLSALALANIICFTVFMLLPVDSPGRLLGGLHTVPLEGYFFTSIADSLRTTVHFPGGCLPSPHCAVSTVMIVSAYRYHRPTFLLILPIIVSIYISTVYGRFHYTTDVPAGVLSAVAALWISHRLHRAWKNAGLTFEIKRSSKPNLVAEGVREEEGSTFQ